LLAITDATTMAASLADDIDKLLRDFAKSDLVDPDPESEEHSKERAEKLKSLQGFIPGFGEVAKLSPSHINFTGPAQS
jgi:hypothetical protein